MAEFILSPDAETDLDEIHMRISVENPEAANQVLEADYQSFQELAQTPGLGRPASSIITSSLACIRGMSDDSKTT